MQKTGDAMLLPRFCEKTGNSCGTDAVHNDEPGCSCRSCMLWYRDELLRRWQDYDRARSALAVWQQLARSLGVSNATPEGVEHLCRGLRESNDSLGAENEKLRIALSDCANHAAGYQCTSGMCSTEFLLHVPEEVRLQIGARERDLSANLAGMQRLEAERDEARAKLAAVQGLDTPWPLLEVLRRLSDAADHLLRDHDCDAHGYEGVGLARDAAMARIAELEAAIKVDLGRADRDAIYRHDLKALAADGATDGCHTDVGTVVRTRLVALRAKVEEFERSYIEESSRNCEAERALRGALLDVLSSATPHPVEHPSMWRTWRQANVLLGRDPDTHVIPTSDKALERRVMSGGRP